MTSLAFIKVGSDKMTPQEVQAAMQAAQKEHSDAVRAAQETFAVAQKDYQDDIKAADDALRLKIQQIQSSVGAGPPVPPISLASPVAPPGQGSIGPGGGPTTPLAGATGQAPSK
jgi:hypothetical protein